MQSCYRQAVPSWACSFLGITWAQMTRMWSGWAGASLVLGLLIASAKGSYDTQSTQVTQMTSNVVLVDNLLAQYGPETNDLRNMLRRGIVVLADRMWR
jgi:hypothetical protein